jgi:hypothetical protein
MKFNLIYVRNINNTVWQQFSFTAGFLDVCGPDSPVYSKKDPTYKYKNSNQGSQFQTEQMEINSSQPQTQNFISTT